MHEQHLKQSKLLTYVCVKDVCKVTGCDSNAKWSVGASKGWEATANNLLAICYQNTLSDGENKFI